MQPGRASGRVLIVDDEDDITSVLEEHFASLGYDVDVAQDGATALIHAAARRPDVVLLDITMPEVSGDEVLSRLLAIDPTVSIVMLTGNSDEDVARDLLRRGALDYVAKPFELATLERVVATAVAVGRR
jgi:DNA-binding response OmpR family regulator